MVTPRFCFQACSVPFMLASTIALCLLVFAVAEARAGNGSALLASVEKNDTSPHSPFPETHHSIATKEKNYTIQIDYPSFGIVLVDNDIDSWVQQRISFFEEGTRDIPFSDPEFVTLDIDYTISLTSLRCISVLFTIQTKTGSPNVEEGLQTITYQPQEGRRLQLDDIFGNTDGLLDFFSVYSRKALTFRDWAHYPGASFIHQGTAPKKVNFMFYTITPAGIDLYFPPNQVASAIEGVIRIPIPLSELQPFQPNTSLWGQ